VLCGEPRPSGRWLIWAVLALIYFFSYFHRIAPSVVAVDLMRAFATSGAVLGVLAAIYLYVFAGMGITAGLLVDRIGPKRILLAGVVTLSLGSIAFGGASSLGFAYLGRFLVGLGASVILISSLRLLADWFAPDEFGTVTGLVYMMGNVGGLFAATPLAALVDRVGWRQSFVIAGLTSLALAALAAALVRERGADGRGAGGAAPGLPLGALLGAARAIAGNRHTWPPVLAATGINASYIAFAGLWGVPYLTQMYGLTRAEAARHMTAIALGLTVGSPAFGFLSDRILRRRRLTYAVAAGGYALTWLPLIAWSGGRPPAPLLLPLYFAFGFLSSGIVVTWACTREVNPPEYAGIAIGIVNTPVFLGTGLLQSGVGALLDRYWTGGLEAGARLYSLEAYRAGFLVCFLVAGLAAACALAVRETRCENRWAQIAREGKRRGSAPRRHGDTEWEERRP
jgi:MFS family permease